jgi:peptidoglycan/LPS O-acetylase OafA/YrhL
LQNDLPKDLVSVVIAFLILWQRLDLPTDTLPSALLFVGACLAIGIAAGAFTHIFIERPVTNLCARLGPSRSGPKP